MNERERKFVEAYMGQCAGNATEAAKVAGYSAKSASSKGSQLLRLVKVQEAIKAHVAADPLVATREQRQRFWTAVMLGKNEHAGLSMKDRLKASELLGKSHGDFIERHEHSGPEGRPIEFSTLSDDERTERLRLLAESIRQRRAGTTNTGGIPGVGVAEPHRNGTI